MVKSTSSWVFDSLLTSSSVKSWNSPTLQSSDPSGENLEPSSLVVFCEVQPALTLHWLPRCRPCGTTWVDRFSCCPRPLRGTRNLLQFPTLFFSEIRCGVFGESYLLVTFFGTLVKPPPPKKTRKNLRSESDKACFDEVSPQKKKNSKVVHIVHPQQRNVLHKNARALPHKKKQAKPSLFQPTDFFFSFLLVWGMTRHDMLPLRRFRFRFRWKAPWQFDLLRFEASSSRGASHHPPPPPDVGFPRCHVWFWCFFFFFFEAFIPKLLHVCKMIYVYMYHPSKPNVNEYTYTIIYHTWNIWECCCCSCCLFARLDGFSSTMLHLCKMRRSWRTPCKDHWKLILNSPYLNTCRFTNPWQPKNLTVSTTLFEFQLME